MVGIPSLFGGSSSSDSRVGAGTVSRFSPEKNGLFSKKGLFLAKMEGVSGRTIIFTDFVTICYISHK